MVNRRFGRYVDSRSLAYRQGRSSKAARESVAFSASDFNVLLSLLKVRKELHWELVTRPLDRPKWHVNVYLDG